MRVMSTIIWPIHSLFLDVVEQPGHYPEIMKIEGPWGNKENLRVGQQIFAH